VNLVQIFQIIGNANAIGVTSHARQASDGHGYFIYLAHATCQMTISNPNPVKVPNNTTIQDPPLIPRVAHTHYAGLWTSV
jgi:hypothetical protein